MGRPKVYANITTFALAVTPKLSEENEHENESCDCCQFLGSCQYFERAPFGLSTISLLIFFKLIKLQ